MKVRISKCRAQGKISAPPSKSVAHRLIICAALADGESHIGNVAFSEDILATLDCICALGAEYSIDGDTVTVRGCRPQKSGTFPCRESGSTLRFFIPLALLIGEPAIFRGSERLIERGVGIYKKLFADNGIKFQTVGNEIRFDGQLTSGEYDIPGNISSQYVSGMMFALAILDGDSVIRVIPPVESRAYIDITVDVMRRFGVEIEEKMPNEFHIHGSQKYKCADISVEGDWSNAAFLYALDCLGGDVQITGLNPDSIQGDKICAEHFERLKKSNAVLDISDCPDLAPILFAFAAANHGAVFTGTRRLKIKESDRAAVMAQELAKFGIKCDVEENSVTVYSGELHTPSATLNGHNDHRIVMSLTVLSTLTGAELDGAQAVKKSYPDFFDGIGKLGIKFEITE